jgi:hypothetical protein
MIHSSYSTRASGRYKRGTNEDLDEYFPYSEGNGMKRYISSLNGVDNESCGITVDFPCFSLLHAFLTQNYISSLSFVLPLGRTEEKEGIDFGEKNSEIEGIDEEDKTKSIIRMKMKEKKRIFRVNTGNVIIKRITIEEDSEEENNLFSSLFNVEGNGKIELSSVVLFDSSYSSSLPPSSSLFFFFSCCHEWRKWSI